MFYAITLGTIHAFHEAKDRNNFIERFNSNPLLPACDAAKIISYEKRALIKTKSNRYVAYDNFSGHYMHEIDAVETAKRVGVPRHKPNPEAPISVMISGSHTVMSFPREFP